MLQSQQSVNDLVLLTVHLRCGLRHAFDWFAAVYDKAGTKINTNNTKGGMSLHKPK